MITKLKFNLNLDINKVVIGAMSLAFVFVISFFVWWQNDIIINNEDGTKIITGESQKSLVTGLPCERADRRLLAVMLASDPITRPISGIGQADIVFEMPVTPNGVTRMMAVYQCESPIEIGSIRSAREDFIPLAAGLGAIYAHWGGEREALKKLNARVMDNIDAMVYETKYFYRKAGVRQPHNGFASFEKLWKGAEELEYGADNLFKGYIHADKKPAKNISNLSDSITIDYPQPFNVAWKYDQVKNSYKRSRGGEPEIDRNTNEQVSVGVVAVLKTSSNYISKDYVNIITVGEGDLEVYQNGIKILGRWKKDADPLGSKLYFYNSDGQEMELAPGKIWVEIITN
ncbi:MAG: DUF3048 domain-containing protein [Candidatus Yanofskybacteria bacterium]|nr:DUF3048 domain-containing protein [Candidatus Yanofskybacteria bacterium]